MQEFSRNWLIKLYYSLALFLFLSVASEGKTDSSGMIILSLMLIVLFFFTIRVFTDKVIVERTKITTKTMFSEKSITVNPGSHIYIKKNSYSFNFILRINNYKIRIENTSPAESLEINADVQDVDELFELIYDLEEELITPKVIDTFNQHGAIQMRSGRIRIDKDGFKVGKRVYKYDNIKGIKVKDGKLVIYSQGPMWDRTLLSKPISEIPNLQTNLYLLSQFTHVE